MREDGVKLVADHCNTVYMSGDGHGDIGQNIAEFKPGVMGVEDRADFIETVEEAYRKDLTERASDGLGYILANNSNSDLEDIIEEGVAAQRPQDYADGFVDVCDTEFDVYVITAGIDDIAEESMETRMNGYTPNVIGTSLIQNGDGVEVESFCAGDEKLRKLRQEYGVDTLANEDIIAFGNSDSNDGPMMQEAPISVGRERAYDSAGLYVEDDSEFWTRATLAGIASEVLEGDNPREAGMRFARRNPDQLEEVKVGGSPGAHTDEILNVYQEVRGEVL